MPKLSSKAKTFLLLIGKKILNQGIIFEDIAKLKEPFKEAVNNLDDVDLKKELLENLKSTLKFLKKKLEKQKASSNIREEPAEGAIPEGSPEVPVEQSLSDAASDSRLKFPFNLYLKNPKLEESLDWLTGKEQNAVCSFYTLNQMESSASCENLLETLTRFQNDDKKKHNNLPWFSKLEKYEKLCLGAQETLPLQNTLLFFLSNITPIAEKCIKKNKPKRAKVLLGYLVSFLHRCHLLKRTIPSFKVMKSPSYEDLVAALLSVYVDLEVTTSVNQVPSDVTRRIIATVSALLGPGQPHCLDVLLQTTKSTRENKPIMWPVFWSLLYLPPDVSSFGIYLRYIICVKYARTLTSKNEYMKLKKIVTCLPAPPNFWKWLLEFNSNLKSLIPSFNMDGMQITNFLLKRSFNSKICKEILERIAEHPDLAFGDSISLPQQQENKSSENNLFFFDTTANKEMLQSVEDNDQTIDVSESGTLTKTVDTLLEEISFAELPENDCGEEVRTFQDSLYGSNVSDQQFVNVNGWFNNPNNQPLDGEVEVSQRAKSSSKSLAVSNLNKAKRDSMELISEVQSTSSLNKSNSINSKSDVKVLEDDGDDFVRFNYDDVHFSDQPVSPIITPKPQRKNSLERHLSNSDTKSKSPLKISFTNTLNVNSPNTTNVAVSLENRKDNCIDLDIMANSVPFSPKAGPTKLEYESQLEEIMNHCLSPLASNSSISTFKKESTSAHSILLKNIQHDDKGDLEYVITLTDTESQSSLIASDNDDDVMLREPTNLNVQAVSSNEQNSLRHTTKIKMSPNSFELTSEKLPVSEMDSSGNLSLNSQINSSKKIKKRISIIPSGLSSEQNYVLEDDNHDVVTPYKQNDSSKKYKKRHSFESSIVEMLGLESYDSANKQKSSTPKTARRSNSFEFTEAVVCDSYGCITINRQKNPIKSKNSFESSALKLDLEDNNYDVSTNKQNNSSSRKKERSNSFASSNEKAEELIVLDADSSEDEIILRPNRGLDSKLSSPKMVENTYSGTNRHDSSTASTKNNSRTVSKVSPANEKVNSKTHVLTDSSQFSSPKRKKIQKEEGDSVGESYPMQTQIKHKTPVIMRETRRRSELVNRSKNSNVSNSNLLKKHRYSDSYQISQKSTNSGKSILRDTDIIYPIKLRPRKSTSTQNLDSSFEYRSNDSPRKSTRKSTRLSHRGEIVEEDNVFNHENENSNSGSVDIVSKRNLKTVTEENDKMDESDSSPIKRNLRRSGIFKKSPRQIILRNRYPLRSKPGK